MKTCSKCGKEKSEERFYFRKDTGKYRSDCKDCCNKRNMNWGQNNKDKRKAICSRYYLNNSEEILKRNTKWRDENKDRMNQLTSEWKKDNPNKARSIRLKSLYNITLEEYNRILDDQNGVCGICQGSCSTGKQLAVDHCHETDVVRGLLCLSCNTSLGGFKDSIKLLNAAIEYLENAS